MCSWHSDSDDGVIGPDVGTAIMNGQESPFQSMETPDELRAKGRRYLELAKAATDPTSADAFGKWAHTLFEMAEMVERGTVGEERLH